MKKFLEQLRWSREFYKLGWFDSVLVTISILWQRRGKDNITDTISND